MFVVWQRGGVLRHDGDAVRRVRGVPAAGGADHRERVPDAAPDSHTLHLVPHRRRRHDAAAALCHAQGLPVSQILLSKYCCYYLLIQVFFSEVHVNAIFLSYFSAAFRYIWEPHTHNIHIFDK